MIAQIAREQRTNLRTEQVICIGDRVRIRDVFGKVYGFSSMSVWIKEEARYRSVEAVDVIRDGYATGTIYPVDEVDLEGVVPLLTALEMALCKTSVLLTEFTWMLTGQHHIDFRGATRDQRLRFMKDLANEIDSRIPTGADR